MQFKKLTANQRDIKRWRAKRNRLVCQILNGDPHISREDALRKANDLMRTK